MEDSVVTRNKALLEKYLSIRGPYYTAFPSPGLWLEEFTSEDYENILKEILLEKPDLPLQLYVHFPFCKRQCFYCQCFQIVPQNESEVRRLMQYLFKEIDLLLGLFNRNSIKPNFTEIHLGGGSPSYMSEDLFDAIIDKMGSFIDLENVSEFAIEIDPRTVTKEKIKHYHKKGVNRISFGIQDIDPEVQKAINRVQPVSLIEDLLQVRHLFKGVNFDLIYGLPKQTRASLRKSLETIVRLSPDRIAFSTLGHRPDVFKHNRLIKESDLPGWIEKAHMWEDSLPFFLENGYERIGMDHFAKPDDELTWAKKNKKLYRNLMGYSPGRFEDNIAIGPSGMTRIVNYYFGNSYDLPDYCSAIGNKRFPIFRGYRLSKDTMLRRDIMNLIMLYYHLDFSFIENKYGINFNEYFGKELNALDEFVQLGVLEITDNYFTVTPLLGDYFLRHLCMVFDNLEREYKHNIESGLKDKSCIT